MSEVDKALERCGLSSEEGDLDPALRHNEVPLGLGNQCWRRGVSRLPVSPKRKIRHCCPIGCTKIKTLKEPKNIIGNYAITEDCKPYLLVLTPGWKAHGPRGHTREFFDKTRGLFPWPLCVSPEAYPCSLLYTQAPSEHTSTLVLLRSEFLRLSLVIIFFSF